MQLAFKKSVVRAEPRIFNGSPSTTSDNPSPTVDASDECGALLVRGFWDNVMDATINIRCVDTDAKSYNSCEPEKVLKSAENARKEPISGALSPATAGFYTICYLGRWSTWL
jgi:hypothetical protein